MSNQNVIKPTIDQELKFNYPGRTTFGEGTCHLRVYKFGNYDHSLLILITALPDEEGLSITNGIEHIATKVARVILPPDLHWSRAIWIEHYPKRGKKIQPLPESFSFVSFHWSKRTDGPATPAKFSARLPSWRYVTRSWVEELLGGQLDV